MVLRLIYASLRFRLPLLIGILVLTVSATSFFLTNREKTNNSLPVWFAKGDAAYANYTDFKRTFGNDRFVVLAFEVPEVFSPDVLQLIQQTTDALIQLPDVENVTSITNAEYIEGSADEIRVHPFVQEIPTKPEDLEKLKQTALNRPEFVGSLISADSKITGIIAKINTPHTVAASRHLKESIEALVAPLNRGRYPFHLSGSPITDESFNRLVTHDQKIFTPAILLLCWILISILFRNPLAALVPVALQLPVIFGTLALYYLLGYEMNAVSGMLIPILVAVSIADSVHMMMEVQSLKNAGMPAREALVAAPHHLWRPCLYTAATTLAGFISFQSSSIAPINTLGNFTAMGVAFSFILTIFFMPVVLSYLPEQKMRGENESPLVQRFLDKALELTEKRPGAVVAVFLLCSLVSIYGVSLLKVETNFMEYYPPQDKTRQDLEFFNQKLGGIATTELVFSAPKPIGEDPTILKSVEEFRKKAFKNPLTKEIQSPTDWLKRLNEVFHDNNAVYNRVPDTEAETAQLYLLASGSGEKEIDKYKTLDNEKIHLTLMTQWTSSEKMNEYLTEMKKEAEKIFKPKGVDVLLTGFGALWVEVDRRIILSQVVSFAIAFVLVSLMMAFFLKSPSAGAISMIPNVIPILFTMGIMGFLKIPLSASTIMIAGITIGITVDDTIHYLARYRGYLQQGNDRGTAARLTNRSIGGAIIFTSSILIGGFGVLGLSSFKPSVYFGEMTALTLFLSVICEIFLTPLLLKWLNPFTIHR